MDALRLIFGHGWWIAWYGAFWVVVLLLVVLWLFVFGREIPWRGRAPEGYAGEHAGVRDRAGVDARRDPADERGGVVRVCAVSRVDEAMTMLIQPTAPT
jgi:hypothetical protein